MDIHLLSEEDFKTLNERLERIERKIEEITVPKKKLHTNDDLCEMFSISKRTAQTWRDTGMIKPTRINGKIYYAEEEIERFLKKYNPKSGR